MNLKIEKKTFFQKFENSILFFILKISVFQNLQNRNDESVRQIVPHQPRTIRQDADGFTDRRRHSDDVQDEFQVCQCIFI